MCDINVKPFEACSVYYNLSPGNMFDVNDCCFQSCYRFQHLGYNVDSCLQNCRQGQEKLTYVAGKSPSQYIRAFKAPPDHDKCSIFGSFIKEGNSPQIALDKCMRAATSEEEAHSCIIDSSAYQPTPVKEGFSEPSPTPKKKQVGRLAAVTFVLIFSLLMAIFFYGFRELVFSTR